MHKGPAQHNDNLRVLVALICILGLAAGIAAIVLLLL
jgi:hypothetical protein